MEHTVHCISTEGMKAFQNHVDNQPSLHIHWHSMTELTIPSLPIAPNTNYSCTKSSVWRKSPAYLFHKSLNLTFLSGESFCTMKRGTNCMLKVIHPVTHNANNYKIVGFDEDWETFSKKDYSHLYSKRVIWMNLCTNGTPNLRLVDFSFSDCKISMPATRSPRKWGYNLILRLKNVCYKNLDDVHSLKINSTIPVWYSNLDGVKYCKF